MASVINWIADLDDRASRRPQLTLAVCHRPLIARHLVDLLRHHVAPGAGCRKPESTPGPTLPASAPVAGSCVMLAARERPRPSSTRTSWSTSPDSGSPSSSCTSALPRSPRSPSGCCRCDGIVACSYRYRCNAAGSTLHGVPHKPLPEIGHHACCRRQTASRPGCSCRRAADRGRYDLASVPTNHKLSIRIGPVTVRPSVVHLK